VTQANKAYDEYIAKLKAVLKQQGYSAAQIKKLTAVAAKPTYDVPTATPAAPTNSSNTIAMVTAQIGVEQALTTAQQDFAWTTPSFNVKTATGQAELQELFSYLSAAQQFAQSVYDATGNAKTATTSYNGYINSIKSVLLKSGLTSARVNDLINRYGKITLTKNRMGGLYTHAAAGALTDAQIAPGGPTRYAWAEPETGGELFAPKNGNLAKTRANVSWAVENWWDGRVTWSKTPVVSGYSAGSSTASAPSGEITVRVVVNDSAVAGLVDVHVDKALGDVATSIIYQTS
jgi:hypothetical protein